jgi:hypothetical protein
MYLPGISDTQLIPPGTTVMLEAGLDFDSRLRPYVIWYNGRNIIHEGNISDGAGSILWEAPDQAGFYSLRLEVFPFRLRRGFSGFSREVTLPVSHKASLSSYFFGLGPEYAAQRPLAVGTIFAGLEEKEELTPPELLHWYRFDGNLEDSLSKPAEKQPLLHTGDDLPVWTALGQSYGLSIGPDDSYQLSPVTFLREPDNEHGGGIFLFHLKPSLVSNDSGSMPSGTIFRALFPYIASANGVQMDMVYHRNAILLRLSTDETVVEIPLFLPYSGLHEFITVAVEFYIQASRLDAKISIGEEYSMQSKTGSIWFHGTLTGKGVIWLGVPDNSGIQDESREQIQAETVSNQIDTSAEDDVNYFITETNKTSRLAMVWNEFAVMYSTLPLLTESETEFEIESALEDEVTEAAEETKNPEAEE